MNIFENAKWIWPKSTQKEINQYCEFIHIFDINELPKNADFYISATKDYNLWINGKFVTFGQWPDYPNIKSYDKINVCDFLTKGTNKIAVLGYNPFTDFCSYISDKAGIIYSLKLDDSTINSGTDTYCRISKTYKNGNIEKLSEQLCYTFEADLRKNDNWEFSDNIPTDFTKITHHDTYEKEAKYILRPVKKLVYDFNKQGKIILSGPFIRKEEFQSAAKTCDRDFLGGNDLRMKINLPCSAEKALKYERNVDVSNVEKSDFSIENGYFIVDMLETVSGHLHLDFTAEENTYLTCSYGEHTVDGRVRANFNTHNFGFRIFASKGENIFDHRMFRIGGRYLQIHVTGKAVFRDARIIPTNYPLTKTAEYKSENTIENKIMDVCTHTLKVCMHDHFEDTPWREQGLYVLDSRNQSLANYYLFGNYDYIKENIRLFTPTLGEDGQLKLTAPSDFFMPIPIFTYAWVMWLKDYVLYSGDLDFAKEMIPFAKIIIEKILDSVDETGLPKTPMGNYWNFVEWKPGLVGDGANTGKYSLPHIGFALCAIDAYNYICEKIFADKIEKNIDKNTVHKAFWCEEKGLYKTFIDSPFDPHFAQISNAMALYSGIVPKEKEDIVRHNLAYNQTLIKSTLSMCMYTYSALLQDPKYSDFVFNDIENQWGKMLYDGATTFWETIPGPWYESGGASLSHGWSAIPAYFYFAFKLGIKPTEPGFKKYEIKPMGLKNATGKILTPVGEISVISH